MIKKYDAHIDCVQKAMDEEEAVMKVALTKHKLKMQALLDQKSDYEHQKNHHHGLVKQAEEEEKHLKLAQDLYHYMNWGGEKALYKEPIEKVREFVELPNALTVVRCGVRELVSKLHLLQALSFAAREDFQSLNEEFFVNRQRGGESKDEMQDRTARYLGIAASDMVIVSCLLLLLLLCCCFPHYYSHCYCCFLLSCFYY